MIVYPFSVNRKLAAGFIERRLQALIRVVNDHFSGRLGCLKIAAATVLVSLLTTFPGYRHYTYRNLSGGPGSVFGRLVLQAWQLKVQHPLTPFPSDFKDLRLYGGPASHVDKMELRLTIPILGWLSGTGLWTVIVWHHLAGFGVFYLLARLASRALDDHTGAGLFVLGLGPTFFGSLFFNDIYCGDGVAFFFMLLSIASGSLLVSSCSLLAAAFCDERCLVTIPLLFLYLLVSHRQDTEKAILLKRCMAIVAGAGMWLLLRTWAASTFHLATGTSMMATRDILRIALSTKLPDEFPGVFKASWTLPLFGLLSLVLPRRWAASWMFAGAFALAAAPAFLVYDFDRSMCYTFIILLVSVHFLAGDRDASRKYLAAILLVNLVIVSPANSILKIVGWF